MRMWGPQSFLGPHLPALLPYFYLSLLYFPLSRITFLFCPVITIVSLGEILKINANEQHLHDKGFVNIIPVRPEWDASITLLSLWSNARTLHTPTQVTMGIPQRHCRCSVQFSSVQSLVSNSLPPHESQHARPPCPLPIPGVYSNSCPSSW